MESRWRLPKWFLDPDCPNQMDRRGLTDIKLPLPSKVVAKRRDAHLLKLALCGRLCRLKSFKPVIDEVSQKSDSRTAKQGASDREINQLRNFKLEIMFLLTIVPLYA